MFNFINATNHRSLSLAITVLFVIAALFVQSAANADIHSHCKVIEYSTPEPIHLGVTNLNNIRDFNLPPAPESMGNCIYEISDITRIDITITFSDPLELIEVSGISFNGVTDGVGGPYDILSGTPISFTFDGHQAAGSLELDLLPPSDRLSILFGDITGWKDFNKTNEYIGWDERVMSFDVMVWGHHYYIPSPGALALLGFAGFISRPRRQ